MNKSINLSMQDEKGRQVHELAVQYVTAKKNGDEQEAARLMNEGCALVYEDYQQIAEYEAENAVPDSIEREGTMFQRIDVEDMLDALIDSLIKAFETYDPEKGMAFTSWMHMLRKQAVASFVRTAKMTERIVNEVPLTAFDTDDGKNTVIDTYGRNMEEEILDKLVASQRKELITHLYNNANERGRAVMEEFAKRPTSRKAQIRTENDVAKSLSLHNFQVARSRQRIKQAYDPERFGPLSDYVRTDKGYVLQKEYRQTIV
jgi:hypothetical protein